MLQLPMVRLLILLMFIQAFLPVNGQNPKRPAVINEITAVKSGEGKVEIIQDRKIDDLLKKYIESNSQKTTITGFCICIYSQSTQGIAKTRGSEVRAKFISKFPGIDASLRYEQPDWRVFVGNFRSHTDAFRLKKQIESTFPNAYIVEKQIDYSKL